MRSVCLVIPCYNEEEGLPSLGRALLALRDELAARFHVSFVFVDDGSSDATFRGLEELKAALENSVVLRHDRNRGLGAALRTATAGLPACDFVCCLDSDCTYDPGIVHALLGKLEEGFDLVTASPYHPEGKVEGVPGWRLFLSRGLSLVYRAVTGAPLHTFTAMVRAQRFEHCAEVLSPRDDFTFVTETLLNGLRRGLRVGEVPAVLRTRRFGSSKMKVLRTIARHIGLISDYLLSRAGRRGT